LVGLAVEQVIPVPVDGIRGLLVKDLEAVLLEAVLRMPAVAAAEQAAKAALAKAAMPEKAAKVDK
jgi:ribosomal protein L12E/L44/L45/RPP1/RPP2